MSKKIRKIMIVMVLVLGFVLSMTSFTSPLFSQRSEKDDDDGGGGGSTILWNRTDIRCPDNIKEKTICSAGGKQQCTAQYCI